MGKKGFVDYREDESKLIPVRFGSNWRVGDKLDMQFCHIYEIHTMYLVIYSCTSHDWFYLMNTH